MRTLEFEQRVLDAIKNATKTSWPDLLVQKLKIKKLKVKTNVDFAATTYKRLVQFEVPIIDGSIILLTIGENAAGFMFHYFGFTADDHSPENLDDMYSKYLMMQALKGR